MAGAESDPSRDSGSTGWRRFSEFWTTLPGVLTGIAAVLGAIAALVATQPDPPDPDHGVAGVVTRSSSHPPCSDARDNDGDGKIDYPKDPDCTSRTDRSEKPVACSDGRDNDKDGQTDYPKDPECTSRTDRSEKPGIPPILRSLDHLRRKRRERLGMTEMPKTRPA